MSITKSVALVSACALATAASATVRVNTVPTFEPVGIGLTENPDVDGMAVIVHDTEDPAFVSNVALVAVGLVRDSRYGVRVDSGGAGQSQAVAFTARTFLGIGIYSTSIPGDATFQTVIDIYRWDGLVTGAFGEDLIFEISPDEERARGFGSNVN